MFQKPPALPLNRKELVKLHLRLLRREHKHEKWERRFYGRDRLDALHVAKRIGKGHGFQVLVLRSTTGRNVPFPMHCLKNRDTVWVHVADDEWPTAVIERISDCELRLVMDKNKHVHLNSIVDVYKFYDDSTYKKMCDALKGLRSLHSGPQGCLCATLFAEPACPLEPPKAQLPPELLDKNDQLELFNACLNPEQRDAVEFAIRMQRLAIIHGPAGTGKTVTAVEVILQHVKLGQRVLACAPSNVAVDNMACILWELWDAFSTSPQSAEITSMIRLGHPARIKEDMLDFWIDKHTRYCYDEWEDLLGGDWEDLAGEKEHFREVIDGANVVLCTLATASAQGQLKLAETGGSFDLLVIDESSQAMEALSWLAIPRAKKLVMFGDLEQLSPLVKNQSAKNQGLGISLMERQMKLHGEAVVRRLDVQYRMNEKIQGWSSEFHYDGLLAAAPRNLRHRLSQLPGVKDTEDTGPTLLLIDTAGCKLTESQRDQTKSLQNSGEARIVAVHAAALAKDGVRQQDIGVITPYNAQTATIRDELRRKQLPEVEVNTIDGFQGREKEVIILSLVRSNEKGNVGFLNDKRRINVAVTRARRQLCVVCDTATLSSSEVIKSLVTYIRENGEVRPARVYMK